MYVDVLSALARGVTSTYSIATTSATSPSAGTCCDAMEMQLPAPKYTSAGTTRSPTKRAT